MIHIINKHNRAFYGDMLKQMFQVRKEVFVNKKGWNLEVTEGGQEIDQFDTDETIYFVKVDHLGQILGGMRLVPTILPTQLGTIFKDWCHFEEPPKAVDVYEWSRYFITDNKYRSEAGYPVHYELFFAILEYAAAHDIVGLSGFLEAVTLPRLNVLPWEVKYLGSIVSYGGSKGEPLGKGAAVYVSVDKRMLRITKRMKHMSRPYMALPLGEMVPDVNIAYQPEVCFQLLDFIAKHPEHVEVLAEIATLIVNSPKDERASLAAWFEQQDQFNALEGFIMPATAGPSTSVVPIAMQ